MSFAKNQDLQLLRGIAISLVIFCHLSLSSTLLAYLNKNLSNPFYWGVELFFVLSGFVVTKSIRKKNYSPVFFLVKRVFRLYPAILFFIITAALINAFIGNSKYPDHIHKLFSVPSESFRNQSLAILGGYLINISDVVSYQYGAMWSLSTEFQFYAAFVVLLFLFLPLHQKIKDKFIFSIFTAVLLSLLIYRIYISIGPAPKFMSNLYYLANYKFDFMASGVLLAFFPVEKLRDFISRFSKIFHPYVILTLTTSLLALLRSPLTPNDKSYDSLNGIGMVVLLFSSTYLVALGSVGHFSNVGLFARPRAVLVRLGDLSYTLYLMHFPIFVLAWVLINELFPVAFSHGLLYGIAQLIAVSLLLIPFVMFGYHQLELRGIAMGERVAGALARKFWNKRAHQLACSRLN
jgi:peptidoglycan/LPS O-acetylase OafA/YrhL